MVPHVRSVRARANDAAIREAAIAQILSRGLDALSFRDIGKAAGLTHGAVYARFEDVEEVLVDLWSELLNARLIALFDAAARAACDPSSETISEALQKVRDAEPADVVAVQVLLLSRRFPIVREEVETFISAYLTTRSPDMSDAEWSRTIAFFSLIMVKIFSNSEFGLNHDRLDFLQPVLVATMLHRDEVTPVERPENSVVSDATSRDDLSSRIARSAYGAIGRSGYTNATISRISRRAECSPGAIYKLHSSKEDLVIFAMKRAMNHPDMWPSQWGKVLDEGVLAAYLTAAMSGENDIRKFFTMEMMMASAHNEKLREAVHVQLQKTESVVLNLSEIDDEEARNLQFMIREISLLTLGVMFLSTTASSIREIEIVQFSEPFRLALLQCFPSWDRIKLQLNAL
jgi:AcrR family transcriptional regulator